MVTQLLFGELFRILSSDKQWLKIITSYDDYEGWIQAQQAFFLNEHEFYRLSASPAAVTCDLAGTVTNLTKNITYLVVIGSSLPGFGEGRFRIGHEDFRYDGLVNASAGDGERLITRSSQIRAKLVSDSKIFLHSPYLWGGRMPFGIDCSGLVQMIYKLQHIPLLRDASRQATQGESVAWLEEAEPGDLAFFDDPEGNIVHTGMLTARDCIIHSSGLVREDALDHEGIFDKDSGKYTHRLRLIRKII
jgi:cell wall-associated NlpC family hydrolase